MDITCQNFIVLQPDAVDVSSNHRLWNFLLISFLLHLLIVELLVYHSSQPGVPRPYKIIPPLAITLNRAPAAPQSVPDSLSIPPVDETGGTERHDNSNEQIPPPTVPMTAPPQTATVLPVQPQPLPKAKELVEKSLAEAAREAKQMEARLKPDAVMTKTKKNKIVMAMMMQDEQDPTIDNPAKLQVYANQYGDLVYQTGDHCAAVPAVFVLYYFTREINSIMATPISCGNDKKESTFSLK